MGHETVLLRLHSEMNRKFPRRDSQPHLPCCRVSGWGPAPPLPEAVGVTEPWERPQCQALPTLLLGSCRGLIHMLTHLAEALHQARLLALLVIPPAITPG